MKRVVLACGLLTAGCVGGGPTPQQSAMLTSEREQNEALAQSHKITWAEAARRNNRKFEELAGSHVGNQERLLMSYRLALAAEVDAGRMTPEMAKYQLEEKKLEIISYNDAQSQAAIQNISNGLLAASVAMQPPPSPVVTCTSNGIGNTVTTMCH